MPLLLLSSVAGSSAAAEQLAVDSVGLNGGLSQSTVTSIAQGPDGFLWFGTPNGLNRYDGYDFMAYHEGDEGLVDDDITALFTHSDGTLWVGTRYAGLYRYDRRRRSFIQAVPWESLRDRITAIAEDATGQLWLGTGSLGVYRIDPTGQETSRVPHDPFSPTTLSSGAVTSLATDEVGRVYVGTADRGLNVIVPADDTVDVYRRQPGAAGTLPSDRITALLIDSRGRLWLAAGDGTLGRFDIESGSYAPVPLPDGRRLGDADLRSGGAVRTLFQDRRGDLWVGRSGGTVLRIRDDAVIGYGVVDAAVHDIHEDESGVIWFATFARGLRKYVPRTEQFQTYLTGERGTAERGRGSLVWALAEDSDESVWIGTDRDGLFRFEPRADPSPTPVWSTPSPIHDVHPSDGSAWVALGSEGAARVGEGGALLEMLPPQRVGYGVLSVHSDGDRVFLGTAGGGLVVVEADGSRRRYETFGPPSPDGRHLGHSVHEIVPDAQGRLWLGVDAGVLVRYTPSEERLERFPVVDAHEPGLVIWSIRPLADGTLWLGAREGGAILYDPAVGVQLHLRPRVDFDADIVYGVVQDDAGGVWLTTNAGLLRVDQRSGTLQRYTEADGLPSQEFSAGAAIVASGGSVYAGAVDGLTRFDPVSVQPSPYLAPVVISAFSVGGEEIAWSDVRYDEAEGGVIPVVTLPERTDSFSCTVAALDYSDPPSNEYFYRLIGVDRDWIAAGHRRMISYSNLRPGDYRLYVRGTNGDGLLNVKGMVMDITVVPPFWQSEWFAVTGIVTVVVVVFLLVRRQLRLVEAQRHELESVVAKRTEDLAASKRTLEREIAVRRRAEESLRRIQSELEYRVAVRTNALREANESLAREVSERESAQVESVRALRENRALLQEIHHRVKNNMQVISSLLSLQAGIVDDAQARHGFEVSRQRINAMALIHERLYRSGDFSQIDMADYFESLISSLRGLHGGAYRVRTHVHSSPLDITMATPCGLLTNELATNAMKHAFPGMDAESEPMIVVEFVEENGTHRLTVADNGIGVDPSAVTGDGTTLGMRIVEVLVQQVTGTLVIRSGPDTMLGRGSEFTIRF